MRLLPLIALGLIVLTTACTKTTTIRSNSQYNAILEKQKEVIILPPTVEVNVIDISNNKKRVYNYEANLEQLAASETSIDMKEMGYNVRIMHRKDFHDLGVYDSYLRLVDAYNVARKELYKPLLWEETKATAITNNLGKTAVILGKKTKSDIIVMVDYEGAVRTTGARAKDFAVGLFVNNNEALSNADSSLMIIGIIDAKTGNILWTNLGIDRKDIFSCAMDNFSSQNEVDVKRLNKLVDDILQPLKK
jgi:hypothetical protein